MSGYGVSAADVFAFALAVGFAAGLNVYLVVFVLGLLARLHWVTLPTGLEPIQNLGFILASGGLYAVEFFADKIPGFDVIWNALHTFIRIPAAEVLAYAAGTHLPPGLHVLLICVTTAVAAIAHSSKTAARVAVTASPEPISNIALSAGEDAAAAGLSWLAAVHPLVAGGTAVALVLASVVLIWTTWRLVRRGFAKAMTKLRAQKTTD